MQQKYILYWQDTMQNSNKLEFFNTCPFKNHYIPFSYCGPNKQTKRKKRTSEIQDRLFQKFKYLIFHIFTCILCHVQVYYKLTRQLSWQSTALVSGSPERVRWLYLARSGSQPQRMIQVILPARRASHIISCIKSRMAQSSRSSFGLQRFC